jgi:KDO2-lipid IV(A) lauroyltransferase
MAREDSGVSSDMLIRMRKRVKRLGEALLVRCLVLLTVILPRRAGLSIFSSLGGLAYRFYRKDRERALKNVLLAFPGTPDLVVGAMARGAFQALGRNSFDALNLSRISREKLLQSCFVSGEENLRRPYARGKGVIVLTGHIGCWEMMAAFMSQKGYKVSVVARQLKNKRLNRMLVRVRSRHGVESIHRGRSAVGGYKVLKKGEILGMLIDQDIDVDGVLVPFFGEQAFTAIGPAVFALKSGAAIVPMAIHMQPDGMHQITILPELEIPPLDLREEQRVYELTRRCSEAVENLVRIYPQQWVWFHDRWRRRPEALLNSAESRYLDIDRAQSG